MAKIVKAEYDVERQTLRLLEPAEGVANGERVDVTITTEAPAEPDWWRFCGALAGEDGESFAHAIEEAFPIER